jgi:glycopeptide antibiotics resistance protein
MNKTLPCYIVSDLLPLYQEDILSKETKKDIDEHLKECEGCKKKMAAMQMPIEIPIAEPELKINPFEKLRLYQNALMILGAIISFLFGTFSPIAIAGIGVLIRGEITSYHIERFKSMGYLFVLENCLVGLGICAIYLSLIFLIRKVSKKKLYDILFYGIMGIYFVIMFWILFQRRASGGVRIINTAPFSTISSYFYINGGILHGYGLVNLIGNILIFVPLGIYLSMLIKKTSVRAYTILVALISLGVEILQYIFALGVADIDDIILNTICGFIGILLFKKLHSIYEDKTKDVITILAPIGGGLAFIIFGLIYIFA